MAACSGRSVVANIDEDHHEAPDFERTLATGQRFGLELVIGTDPTLAKSRSDIHDRFVPELQEARRARLIGATFT